MVFSPDSCDYGLSILLVLHACKDDFKKVRKILLENRHAGLKGLRSQDIPPRIKNSTLLIIKQTPTPVSLNPTPRDHQTKLFHH